MKNRTTILKTLFSIITVIALGKHSFGQKTYSLSECLQLAENNYPSIKQKELILKSEQYNLSNLTKGTYPQISLNGQGTWQSEVTSFKIPGVNFTPPSKDQYKTYAEITQPLTELHTVKAQKEMQKAQTAVQMQTWQTEIYKIRERIYQLYFGIQLTQEQIQLNNLVKKDLETGINKVTAAINNGTEYRSSLDKLNAELLRIKQRFIELSSAKKAYVEMLSYFIGQNINENDQLSLPATPSLSNTISRPELNIFSAKEKSLNIQQKIINNKNLPRFSLFAQGGAGQPSPLNLIMRDFRPYFIGGLKMSWNFNSLYTQKNEIASVYLEKKNNEIQKELFLFNTNMAIKQQNNELNKTNQLIESDEELIQLRNSIKNTAQIQLENGIISTSDYIKEVNAEDQARQNKALHQIQLLAAQYNLQYISGN